MDGGDFTNHWTFKDTNHDNNSLTNFVFLGEAGSGKSEIAINAALSLVEQGDKPVHFFDLDMTKPLFRSRDVARFLESKGIIVHFEEQFYDAPTTAGGVERLVRDEKLYTVLDIGGDYIGARSIGGYAGFLNTPASAVWYVINPYRPWSMDIDHIDKVMAEVLGVSHIRLDNLKIAGNPNMGIDTSSLDVVSGADNLLKMIEPYKPVDFFAVKENLVTTVQDSLSAPVFPIKTYLTYEWEQI